jgi:hypothetical protein
LHHKLFDRGVLGIGLDMRIRVSSTYTAEPKPAAPSTTSTTPRSKHAQAPHCPPQST